MFKRSTAALMLGFAIISLGPLPSVAQNLPETVINVIGSASFSNIHNAVEKPFWNKTLPEASGGKITAKLTALTSSGLKGPEIMRLLSVGALDVAFGDFGSVAGDDPMLEGLDLAGVITNLETLQKAAEAYKPAIASTFEKHGIKLMGLFPFPEYAFFCKGDVASLGDIKGKKVRVYTKSMTEFVELVGGVPVTIPFSEVVPALQSGVADCAITGTFSGNRAGWAEITDSLFTLPVGGGLSFYGYSRSAWDKLDPAVQKFLDKQFAAFEDRAWEVTLNQTQDGINCNTRTGECKMGKLFDMKLHKPSEADLQLTKSIATKSVLPNWAKRCGEECVATWNKTVGAVAGVTAGKGS